MNKARRCTAALFWRTVIYVYTYTVDTYYTGKADEALPGGQRAQDLLDNSTKQK